MSKVRVPTFDTFMGGNPLYLGHVFQLGGRQIASLSSCRVGKSLYSEGINV